METRNQIISTETTDSLQTVLPTVCYSWEGQLQKAQSLLERAVADQGLFDQDVVDTFTASRQENGRYQVHTNDPLLIQNAKGFINVLHAIRQLLPDMENSAEVLLSQGLWAGAKELGLLAMLNPVTLVRLGFDIEQLVFSLHELIIAIRSLPRIDSQFIPLLNNLRGSVQESLQPIVTLLQKNADYVDSQQQDHIQETALLLEGALSEFDYEMAALQPAIAEAESAASEQEEEPFVTIEEEDLAKFKKIYAGIAAVQQKIISMIEHENISYDIKTGLFDETTIADPNTLNLVKAANALGRFKLLLKQMDSSNGNLNVIGAIKKIGAAIKTLQEIDISAIQQRGADELLIILKAAMKELEPILMEMTRLLEMTELRFGLREGALHEQFQALCQSYEQLAHTLDIPLQQHYPYWEQRLLVRQDEQQRNQKASAALVAAKAMLEKPPTATTSLQQLIIAHQQLIGIPSFEVKSYRKKLDKMIAEKAGLPRLQRDIARQETIVSELPIAQDASESVHPDVAKLNKLYQLHEEVKQQLAFAMTHPEEASEWLQAREAMEVLQTRSTQVADVLTVPSASLVKSARAACDTLLLAATRDSDRLQNLASIAASHAWQDTPSAIDDDKKPAFQALLDLEANMSQVTPEALYTMPLADLQAHIAAVATLAAPAETNAYVAVLSTAIAERSQTQAAAVSSEDQKTIATLERFIEEAIHHPERRITAGKAQTIANKLAISVDAVHALQADTLMAKMREKIAELNVSHPEQPYRGTLLATWASAEEKVLRLIATQKIAYFVAPVQVSPSVGEAHAVKDDSVVAKSELVKKEKGPLQLNLEKARVTIKQLVSTDYLTADAVTAFHRAALEDGRYRVDMSDPELIKVIKALLNALNETEKLASQFTFRDGIFLGAMAIAENAETQMAALNLELKDLVFYLGALQTSFSELHDKSELEAFSTLNEIVNPTFAQLKSWLAVPSMAALVKETDIVDKVDATLNYLSVIASGPELPAEIKGANGPLQSAIATLDHSLNDFDIYRNAKGLYRTKNLPDGEIKNKALLANALIELQQLMRNLALYSDTKGISIQDTSRIISNVIVLVNMLKRFKNVPDDMKAALKIAMEALHPLLTDAASRTELVEMHLGVKPDLLEAFIGDVCRNFESFAQNFGANLTTTYPYHYQRFLAFQDELTKQRDAFAVLEDVGKKIAGNYSFHTMLLADLVKTRVALTQFPPSMVGPFLAHINQLIAERTGQGLLDKKIKAVKDELIALEKVIATTENELILLQREQRSVEAPEKKLVNMIEKLEKNEPLTTKQITFLHYLYNRNRQPSLSFEDFCNKLVEPKNFREQLKQLVDEQLNALQARKKIVNDDIDMLKENIAAHHLAYQGKQSELQQYEVFAVELVRKTAAIKHDDALAFKFVPGEGLSPPSLVPGFYPVTETTRLDEKTRELASQQLLEARTSLKEKKKNTAHLVKDMEKEQRDTLTALLADRREKLSMMEKELGYPAGKLTFLAECHLDDMAFAAKRIQQLSSARGVINLLTANSNRAEDYAKASEGTYNVTAFLGKIAKEAGARTTKLARWIRQLTNRQNKNDVIRGAARWLNDPNNRDAFEQRPSALSLPSRSLQRHKNAGHFSMGEIASAFALQNGVDVQEELERIHEKPDAEKESEHAPVPPQVVADDKKEAAKDEEDEDRPNLGMK